MKPLSISALRRLSYASRAASIVGKSSNRTSSQTIFLLYSSHRAGLAHTVTHRPVPIHMIQPQLIELLFVQWGFGIRGGRQYFIGLAWFSFSLWWQQKWARAAF